MANDDKGEWKSCKLDELHLINPKISVFLYNLDSKDFTLLWEASYPVCYHIAHGRTSKPMSNAYVLGEVVLRMPTPFQWKCPHRGQWGRLASATLRKLRPVNPQMFLNQEATAAGNQFQWPSAKGVSSSPFCLVLDVNNVLVAEHSLKWKDFVEFPLLTVIVTWLVQHSTESSPHMSFVATELLFRYLFQRSSSETSPECWMPDLLLTCAECLLQNEINEIHQ